MNPPSQTKRFSKTVAAAWAALALGLYFGALIFIASAELVFSLQSLTERTALLTIAAPSGAFLASRTWQLEGPRFGRRMTVIVTLLALGWLARGVFAERESSAAQPNLMLPGR